MNKLLILFVVCIFGFMFVFTMSWTILKSDIKDEPTKDSVIYTPSSEKKEGRLNGDFRLNMPDQVGR